MSKTRGVYEKDPGSGVFWVRYVDASGKYRREKAGTKAHARILYAKRKTEALQGRKLPETLRSAPITFSDLAADALEYSRLHKSSASKDEERMKLMQATFGSCTAAEITPQQITAKLRKLRAEKNWSAGTVNRYKALLSLTYRIALENGKVTTNPARFVRRIREENTVIRYLEPDEESRLKSVIEPNHPERWAAILFAMETGLRASEQYRLTWADVMLTSNALVSVRKSKSGKMRHIPLSAAAQEALAVMRGRPQPGDKVFVSQPYRVWFELALKAAGIADFTWHCLRHTFASRLIMAGADIRTVAELMGHATIQMTMRYAHLAPEHNALTIAKLDAFRQATGTREETSTIIDTSNRTPSDDPTDGQSEKAFYTVG